MIGVNVTLTLFQLHPDSMPAGDAAFVRGNQAEAAVWLLIAAGFAWYAYRQSGARRQRCIVALAAFGLFGLSDLVEIRTGAWWRPWWLLAWKAACLGAMLWLAATEFWPRRKSADARSPDEPAP